MNNLLKSSKKLKTTLGLMKALLISRLKFPVRELAWKLHTASYQRLEKYQRKSLVNGHLRKTTIWLPNFFEGKDPFDGKQTDEKGIPAGGVDKRGAHVEPAKQTKKVEEETEF